jgi:hypothetical protein
MHRRDFFKATAAVATAPLGVAATASAVVPTTTAPIPVAGPTMADLHRLRLDAYRMYRLCPHDDPAYLATLDHWQAIRDANVAASRAVGPVIVGADREPRAARVLYSSPANDLDSVPVAPDGEFAGRPIRSIPRAADVPVPPGLWPFDRAVSAALSHCVDALARGDLDDPAVARRHALRDSPDWPAYRAAGG